MDLMETSAKQTKFSHPALPSRLLSAGEKYYINGYGLLVNFNPKELKLNNAHNTELLAFSSIIRCNEYISPALSCLLFELPEDPIHGVFITWDEQEVYPGMQHDNVTSQAVDFFRSPQEDISLLSFPPQKLSMGSDVAYDSQSFVLKANLWFAEAGTHCGIHNKHSFIEIHTQILGIGCMQTFQSENKNSLCEDLIMAPGITTSQAFCRIDNGQYIYPYHQYYADTSCVWLALEYHPKSIDEVKNVR
jgi:hypothetical protein